MITCFAIALVAWVMLFMLHLCIEYIRPTGLCMATVVFVIIMGFGFIIQIADYAMMTPVAPY